MSVRITVISGFLGAGKTTLMKSLLENHVFGRNPVLIENDYGALNIDDATLQESGMIVKDISIGCICCSVAGDFTNVLEEIISSCQTEDIIIEPSGVGKLSDILELLQGSRLYSTCKISQITAITVINPQKFWHNDKYVSEFFWNQIRNGNLLVLNNAQKLPAGEIDHICSYIRAHHSRGTILKDMNAATIKSIKKYLSCPPGTPMISMHSLYPKKPRLSGTKSLFNPVSSAPSS